MNQSTRQERVDRKYYEELSARMANSLTSVRSVFAAQHTVGSPDIKPDGSFLTNADSEICSTLRSLLVNDGEGWISEEDIDLSPNK
jgi:hypothetical protein